MRILIPWSRFQRPHFTIPQPRQQQFPVLIQSEFPKPRLLKYRCLAFLKKEGIAGNFQHAVPEAETQYRQLRGDRRGPFPQHLLQPGDAFALYLDQQEAVLLGRLLTIQALQYIPLHFIAQLHVILTGSSNGQSIHFLR